MQRSAGAGDPVPAQTNGRLTSHLPVRFPVRPPVHDGDLSPRMASGLALVPEPG